MNQQQAESNVRSRHLDVEFEHQVKELTGWLEQALKDCDVLSRQLEAATVGHAGQLAQSLTNHRQEVNEWATAAEEYGLDGEWVEG